MKTLILDNYDSFTFNLVEFIRQCGITDFDVIRNDQITVEECEIYDQFIISPGPGVPKDAGILTDLIKTYGPTKKILGICLGMQAIGEVYGCDLVNLDEVYHGVSTSIKRTKINNHVFKNLPQNFLVGRYHSWGINQNGLSDQILPLAFDDNHIVMALTHKDYDITGLQFHPESVLTENGMQMIANWLSVPEPEMELCFPSANSSAFDISKIERSLFV